MKKRIAIAVELKDRLAFTYSHSKDVTLILKTLKEKCRWKWALGSFQSLSQKPISKGVYVFFGWTQYFSSIQVYAKTKYNHLNKIKKELNHDGLDNAVFFDDKMTKKEFCEHC